MKLHSHLGLGVLHQICPCFPFLFYIPLIHDTTIVNITTLPQKDKK
uniref:Uncharacterized protein n=1 Tax=Rhizophora mucronata TaxID=61149 RepID=A0A2P2JME2_RHIMU